MEEVKEKVKEKLKERISSWEVKSPRRIYFWTQPSRLREIARVLFEEFEFRFVTASAVDTLKGVEILYHFSCDSSGEIFTVKVLLPSKSPKIESIAPFIPGAAWIEREMGELFGVEFLGHPEPKRLLLSEDWPKGVYPYRLKEEK